MAVYREATDATAPAYLATTTDGGKTWKARQYNFTQNNYQPIYLFTPENSKLMYVLCSGGQIFGTSDLGNNWIPVLNEYTGTIETAADIVIQKSIVRLWQVGLGLSYLDFALVPMNLQKEIKLTSDSTLYYDTVNVGSNKLKYISLKNIGNVTVSIKARIDTINSFSDEFKFFGSIADSIAPGEEIQIRVRFVPKHEGLRYAKLIIESEAVPYTIKVDLIGVGRNLPTLVENLDNTLALYPNPVKEKLFVTGIESSKSLLILVYDAFGREVCRIQNPDSFDGQGNFEIDATKLSSGFYTIKIITEKQTINSKFIKM